MLQKYGMLAIKKQINTLKVKIILFMLAFSSVIIPLPCRGVACSSCFTCFLLLPFVMASVFFRRLKKWVGRVIGWLRRERSLQFILSVLIGFTIPLGLGVYHGMVRGGESYHTFYSFPSEKARPIIFYYGTGGIAKLIDPNTLGVTISLRNIDKKPT